MNNLPPRIAAWLHERRTGADKAWQSSNSCLLDPALFLFVVRSLYIQYARSQVGQSVGHSLGK